MLKIHGWYCVAARTCYVCIRTKRSYIDKINVFRHSDLLENGRCSVLSFARNWRLQDEHFPV